MRSIHLSQSLSLVAFLAIAASSPIAQADVRVVKNTLPVLVIAKLDPAQGMAPVFGTKQISYSYEDNKDWTYQYGRYVFDCLIQEIGKYKNDPVAQAQIFGGINKIKIEVASRPFLGIIGARSPSVDYDKSSKVLEIDITTVRKDVGPEFCSRGAPALVAAKIQEIAGNEKNKSDRVIAAYQTANAPKPVKPDFNALDRQTQAELLKSMQGALAPVPGVTVPCPDEQLAK